MPPTATDIATVISSAASAGLLVVGLLSFALAYTQLNSWKDQAKYEGKRKSAIGLLRASTSAERELKRLSATIKRTIMVIGIRELIVPGKRNDPIFDPLTQLERAAKNTQPHIEQINTLITNLADMAFELGWSYPEEQDSLRIAIKEIESEWNAISDSISSAQFEVYLAQTPKEKEKMEKELVPEWKKFPNRLDGEEKHSAITRALANLNRIANSAL